MTWFLKFELELFHGIKYRVICHDCDAVTSPAQLLHRRMVCRADLLTTKYCKMIRKACGELCGITKVGNGFESVVGLRLTLIQCPHIVFV